MTTIYDTVPYPRHSYGFTHPDRLATLAALHGLNSPPIERARVLELGCAGRANLVPLAYALPEAEFLGVDLSQRQIAEGQEVIAALGLKNIRLAALDICDIDEQFGQFDYIIAQGLYSWVPAAAREAILRICSRQLSETGVALISYNAYPGCHLRDMVRGMAQFHTRDLNDPQEQVGQLHGLVKFLAESAPDDGASYTRILRSEAERLGKLDGSFILHDVLEGTNWPVYFHEFVAHAGGYGLQYLCEALPLDRRSARLAEPVLAELRKEYDPLEFEQYLDFLSGTAFRRTLVCHQRHAVALQPKADVAGQLLIASSARATSHVPDITGDTAEEFTVRKGPYTASLRTDQPLAKAALAVLIDTYPRALRMEELLAAAAVRLGRAATANDRESLSEIVLAGFAAHMVELHRWQPPVVGHASEFPQASAVARLQAARGWELTTLWHDRFAVSNPVALQLIAALDGQHDRQALVEQLLAAISASGASLTGGAPSNDAAERRRQVASQMETALVDLARSAVLIA